MFMKSITCNMSSAYYKNHIPHNHLSPILDKYDRQSHMLGEHWTAVKPYQQLWRARQSCHWDREHKDSRFPYHMNYFANIHKPLF